MQFNGKAIKEARKEKGLTQKELGEKVGYAKGKAAGARVGELERNEVEPGFTKAMKVCFELELNPYELLLGRESKIEKTKNKHYSKAAMLNMLRKKAKELNRTPREKDIKEDIYLPGVSTYRRRFGSYTKACELVDLEPNKKVRD